jgi:hypothetical protein
MTINMPKRTILTSKCNYARGSLIALLVNTILLRYNFRFVSIARYTCIVYNVLIEKETFMRNIPITLTLPEDLIKDLHLYISRRQISKFVAEQVENGLKIKRETLAREFREANQDAERNAEIELWDTLIGDGINETNKY